MHKEKCKPHVCGRECKKFCPVEKKERDSCVVIEPKCVINEKSCIGCSICEKRCPFGAIEIVNLPEVKEEDIVHRFGENKFALYGLPVPREGSVIGLLGRNGIGKSTAIQILAGKLEPNFGVSEESESCKGSTNNRGEDFSKHFQGSELKRYFDSLKDKKISYKPQNLSSLSKNVRVVDLLGKFGSKKEIEDLAKRLNVLNVLENKMDRLSGGELQRVAILAASLNEADVYFFDEPLAYLDISERLRVSDFILSLAKEKTIIVVEHDLLILDYLTDYLNIFYGAQGAFGLVSSLKSSKEGINAYLKGFLRDENLRIRDKELNFNFSKNASSSGRKIAEWPDFKVAFDNFGLAVSSGEIRENHVIGILGRNGTGKTSFVRALAGELAVESEGKKKSLDLGLEISHKPQYLFSEEDSEEVVRDVMFKEKISKKLAASFNLGVLQQKKLKDLSGGELQRFSVARCLSKDASVYLIDEPSAYLDVEERISVAKAIKEFMVENEKTAFVVDHDLLLISYLADSVINFSFEDEKTNSCVASEVRNFGFGVSELLKSLDVTLRKDKDSGRPRINKKGSVLDREQKEKGEWVVF